MELRDNVSLASDPVLPAVPQHNKMLTTPVCRDNPPHRTSNEPELCTCDPPKNCKMDGYDCLTMILKIGEDGCRSDCTSCAPMGATWA